MYRLVRSIFNTAVDDGRIKRNPCWIKGAGEHRSAERTTAAVPQIYALAEQMPAVLVDQLRRHIERYAGPGAEGLVFRGEKGAMLRRGNFGRSTKPVVVVAAGLPAGFTSTISDTPVTSSRPTPARRHVS